MNDGQVFLGFDRNDYPGDAALDALAKSFRFSGFWLNAPPGERVNSWTGKRRLLKQHRFGFLLLFNGRLERDLRNRDATNLGMNDGLDAVLAAEREGFSAKALIFLDQEEGGRLLPEQQQYIFAWIAAVRERGGRAGVYCSGIEVPDGPGKTISTAGDVAAEARRQGVPVTLWVANDQCPPSPGCERMSKAPEAGGVPGAAVWQYAQSPRRVQFSGGCPSNAAPDGNCYAPGLQQGWGTFLDMDVANSPNPSEQP